MTVFVDDPDFVLHVGDALEVLAGLPDESVHCVVTSPPYWGLRDYGTGSWDGGDEHCDHKGAPLASDKSGLAGYTSENVKVRTNSMPFASTCGKCGARRTDHQLGLEPTPDEYVTNMVGVFREVRRVLRRDGTCWLNIGDSYAGTANGRSRFGQGGDEKTIKRPGYEGQNEGGTVDRPLPAGLKQKDLCGVPWRLAFALQADGWYLRSDIIWSKPNPMPESVTDRPTKAHEYLFLLTRSPRYFYDGDAVREDFAPKTLTHRGNGKAAGKVGQQDGTGKVASGNYGDWDKARTAYPPPRPQDETLDGSEGEAPRGADGRRATRVKGADGSIQHRDGERWPNVGRNKRSVWEIATQPYPDAHFATFPQALVEPCVLAGTSERGCCPVCGAPWERETERASPPGKDMRTPGTHTPTGDGKISGAKMQEWLDANPRLTTGWRPTCDHGTTTFHGETVPCTVLDPFMGSRTIGIELSPEYATLAAERLQQLSLFADA